MTGVILLCQSHASLRLRIDDRDALAALPAEERALPRETLRLEAGTAVERGAVDWPTLHREQHAWIQREVLPMLERFPGHHLRYFGATWIPLAVDLGQQVARWRKAKAFQHHHRTRTWAWAPDGPPVRVRVRGEPRDPIDAPGDVVIRVSTSFRVDSSDTRAVVGGTLAEIDIETSPLDEDVLATPADLFRVVERFRRVLNGLRGTRPAATLHLFLAVPLALAFELGQAIHPGVHVRVQTWQFVPSATPRYRRALILGNPEPPEDSMNRRILFVAAEPRTAQPLRIATEHHGIRQRLLEGLYRDRFSFEDVLAVRRADLVATLDRRKAEIIHFSGHATADGRLVLEGPNGEGREVGPEDVAEVFEIVNEDHHIQLVVLNACYTERLARLLTERGIVPAAIGTTAPLTDPGAIAFSSELYRALSDGNDVRRAFGLAVAHLRVEGHRADASVVRLFIVGDEGDNGGQ